jgi:hypothetical protein
MNLVSADLDVSGKGSGGSIQIGAASDVKTIYLGGDTRLSANAKEQGNGGQILILSEEQTMCYGTIEARGGVFGGNGGQIEISGKEQLGCYAACDASAPFGTKGSILLDPKNMIVDTATGIYPQYSLIDPSVAGTGFGNSVAVLSAPYYNIVVTKPSDSTAAATAGAVYLYNGLTAALISTILGSTAADQIGSGGIVTLSGNGNYVFRSPNWDNGVVLNAGAVTWGSALVGVSGSVSSFNSLVGTTGSDQVGSTAVTALSNGNYVVASSNWDNGATTNVGAVTWGNGATGTAGAVSTANSLYGTVATDQVGSGGVTALSNGNYVVRSPHWINGAVADAGAVTWLSGVAATAAAVSTTNSLYGTHASDNVGGGGVAALANGNYVVGIPDWDNGAVMNVGAATWGDGSVGTTGAVSTTNSLYGTVGNDGVGLAIAALANGNYVVVSSVWDNGATGNAGAVTWGNGTTGTVGAVSTTNSLYGTHANDNIGGGGITPLSNDNYVVASPNWDNGVTANVGAVTWADGTTATAAAVSTTNSLYGSSASDAVGTVTALANGNYVVLSTSWDNGATSNVGAATWGDGTVTTAAAVSTANSLYGTTSGDMTSATLIALANGNYVLRSPFWNNGAVTDAGAVTWGDGVGGTGVTALTNGSYVVSSPGWDNGATSNVGAATWANGTAATAAAVSTSNSLYGGSVNDNVGLFVTALDQSTYVVASPNWDNGATANAGAATWGSGTTGITGVVSPQNSIVGPITNSSLQPVIDFSGYRSFVVRFTGGVGFVLVGLGVGAQTYFTRAEGQSMTIQPSFITDNLASFFVDLQTNNDFTLSSSLTFTQSGTLTIQAGRSVAINANVTLLQTPLTVVANDLLASGVVDADRDAGNAALNVASGVTINTGTGNLSLSLLNGAGKTNSGSGNVDIGSSAVLQCSGTAQMTLLADVNDVVLNTGVLVQTDTGNLTITAGGSLVIGDSVTVQPTGVGAELILDTGMVSY